MKSYICLFLFLPFLCFSQSYKKVKRVLFLGNSYTYVNNLPALISGIALAKGDSLIFDSNCPGGYTFSNHCNDAASISKISAGNWDYVVLQAQSQEPSFSPAQVAAQTLPYAVKLDSIIKKYNPCAITVFYETWGRKNGDVLNCGAYPPVCTYAGMQNRLRQSYKLFADTAKGVMVPAGEAFRSSLTFSPSLELYQPDESHPSLEGSYLTACGFYESLFQRSVISNTFNPGIGSGTLTFLQQRAHEVVNDSLDEWNIGKYMAWADFTFSPQSANSFQFSGKSPTLQNWWYFGDGGVSQLSGTTHTYVSSGTYNVWHVVKKSCQSDSVSQVVEAVNTVGLDENSIASDLLIFPNPCQGLLHITPLIKETHYEIRNVLGKMCMEGQTSAVIDISPLERGIYYLEIAGEVSVQHVTFIRE